MNQETLKKAVKAYLETEGKYCNIHTEELASKAFKAGAEWQRNHVWHKPTEQPEEPRLVLSITKYGAFICGPNHFKTIAWAYVDELKPVGFDEIIQADKDVLERLKGGEG